MLPVLCRTLVHEVETSFENILERVNTTVHLSSGRNRRSASVGAVRGTGNDVDQQRDKLQVGFASGAWE